MMNSLSNKLFVSFYLCFIIKTEHLQRVGEESALQGFNHLNKYKDIEVSLDPGLHTLAMAVIYKYAHTHTNKHTDTHTHSLPHIFTIYTPARFIWSILYQLRLPRGMTTHAQRLNKPRAKNYKLV